MVKLAGSAMALILLGSSGAFALDARNPDPLSVLEAAYAAMNVGNMDASMGFLTDDAELIDSRGRKTEGRDGMRRWLEGNRRINIQINIGPNPVIEGNKIRLRREVAIPYFEQFGIKSVVMGTLIVIDGDKLKYHRPYFPLFSIKQLEMKCDAPEGRDIKIAGQPCDQFARGLRNSTQSLISAGMVADE